ncbi:MAG: hypothetical protein J6M07_09905 [Ruminococcus sp.]|jgi:uncharacterized membrane protein|nr:hypothetical protein [Ruminococcus sp.]MBP3268614.1 hypothetical protein [Ruminococcus sp.]
MDNFAEQLVKRNETSSDKTRKNALLVIGILITVCLAAFALLQLGNPLRAFFGLILAAASGYGTFFMYRNSYVEYEYAFTNGELDIDKITAKSKRTSMVSTEVRQFTAFGKYDENMKETEEMTLVMATDNIAAHEYYADFTHEEHGKTRLIFCPDEKMLENIRKFLPARLRTEQNNAE